MKYFFKKKTEIKINKKPKIGKEIPGSFASSNKVGILVFVVTMFSIPSPKDTKTKILGRIPINVPKK